MAKNPLMMAAYITDGENLFNESIPGTSTNSSENQSSCSGFDSEVIDLFNGIFYHLIPSVENTKILFYNKPLFGSILYVLANEFKTPQDQASNFTLKTHVDGKKCIIKVDKNDLSFHISGPGHTMWVGNNFRKMTTHMYENFVQDTNAALNLTQRNPDPSPVPAHNCTQNTAVESDKSSPNINMEILTLKETISVMQAQIVSLTSQVDKLLHHATSDSIYQTIDETQSNIQISDPVLYETISSVSMNHDTSMTATDPQPPSRRTSTPTLREPELTPKSRPMRKKTSPRQTLLIGDSIVSGINPKGLKQHVYRNGIPGARVGDILDDIKVYNLINFTRIIIYVGGNDSSGQTDMKSFERKYDELIKYIKDQNSLCTIVLCNSCPRGDTDTRSVNNTINKLSTQHGTELIDMDRSFHGKDGSIPMKYYSKDSIHLSPSGVRRFLGTLNVRFEIVDDFDRCVFEKRNIARQFEPRQSYSGNVYPRRTPPGRMDNYRTSFVKNQNCYKCGETNHITMDCRHREPIKCYECSCFGHKGYKCVNRV